MPEGPYRTIAAPSMSPKSSACHALCPPGHAFAVLDKMLRTGEKEFAENKDKDSWSLYTS